MALLLVRSIVSEADGTGMSFCPDRGPSQAASFGNVSPAGAGLVGIKRRGFVQDDAVKLRAANFGASKPNLARQSIFAYSSLLSNCVRLAKRGFCLGTAVRTHLNAEVDRRNDDT
jgi:hypothetical protein